MIKFYLPAEFGLFDVSQRKGQEVIHGVSTEIKDQDHSGDEELFLF